MAETKTLRIAAVQAAIAARRAWHQMRRNPAIAKYAEAAREHMRTNLRAARIHKNA